MAASHVRILLVYNILSTVGAEYSLPKHYCSLHTEEMEQKRRKKTDENKRGERPKWMKDQIMFILSSKNGNHYVLIVVSVWLLYYTTMVSVTTRTIDSNIVDQVVS
jgi:hypothetical protein